MEDSPTPAVLLLQPAATLSTPQRQTTKHVPVFGRMFFPRGDSGGLTSLLYPSVMQSHKETHAVFTDTQLWWLPPGAASICTCSPPPKTNTCLSGSGALNKLEELVSDNVGSLQWLQTSVHSGVGHTVLFSAVLDERSRHLAVPLVQLSSWVSFRGQLKV